MQSFDVEDSTSPSRIEDKHDNPFKDNDEFDTLFPTVAQKNKKKSSSNNLEAKPLPILDANGAVTSALSVQVAVFHLLIFPLFLVSGTLFYWALKMLVSTLSKEKNPDTNWSTVLEVLLFVTLNFVTCFIGIVGIQKASRIWLKWFLQGMASAILFHFWIMFTNLPGITDMGKTITLSIIVMQIVLFYLGYTIRQTFAGTV